MVKEWSMGRENDIKRPQIFWPSPENAEFMPRHVILDSLSA
jgi:hypothetical protein